MRDSRGKFIKGHRVLERWKKKSRSAHLGKKHTEEWKKEHSARMLGNTNCLGHTNSPEANEKNRRAQIRRYDRIGRANCSASLRERHSKRYRNWMRSMLQRDGFRCRITGLSGSLSAHHIEDFGKNVSLRYELSNGFTMLKILHLEFHKIYGFGKNTRKQLEEFSRVCQRLLSEIDILSPMANCHEKEVQNYGSSNTERKSLYGALYEVIYRVKAIKFGEPSELGIPSEASKEERVETRQSLPIFMGKGIVQTTNLHSVG